MFIERKFLSSLFAIAALGTTTNASLADDNTFTGFYAGVHGGFASVDTDGIFDPGGGPGEFFLNELDVDGAAVGGQIGYSHQMGNFVVGIEGDISSLTGDDQIPGEFPLGPGSYQIGAQLDHIWSVRGRLGAAWGDWLLFGTAGYGEIDYKATSSEDTIFIFPANKLSFESDGAVYGGGVEYAFGKVLVRVEYLHYDVGKTVSLEGLNPDFDGPDNLKIDDVDIVRGALSIKLY